MYTLKFLAPILGGFCFHNATHGQGDYCNLRQDQPVLVRYGKSNPEHACYRDGIFYSRCKDLENPEVLHYHNLLKTKNDQL
jgi:hypothetical protein